MSLFLPCDRRLDCEALAKSVQISPHVIPNIAPAAGKGGGGLCALAALGQALARPQAEAVAGLCVDFAACALKKMGASPPPVRFGSALSKVTLPSMLGKNDAINAIV